MERENEVKKSDDRQTDSRQRVGMRSSDGERSVASEATITIKRRVSASPSPTQTPFPATTLRSRGVVGARTAARSGARESARPREESRNRGSKLAVLEDLIEQSATLDRKQAQQLLDQLSLRMQTSDRAVQNRDLEAWCTVIHAEISRELGTDRAYGIMQVRKALSEPGCWEAVEAFMEAAGLEQHTSAQRRAMYMLLAEMVLDRAYEDTKRYGGSVTLQAVARCSLELVRIFDDAFPGYLRSGLAFMVAEQQQRIATGKTSI